MRFKPRTCMVNVTSGSSPRFLTSALYGPLRREFRTFAIRSQAPRCQYPAHLRDTGDTIAERVTIAA